jgi:hypothetical protein
MITASYAMAYIGIPGARCSGMTSTPQTLNTDALDKVQGGWGFFHHRPHYPPPWMAAYYGGFYGPPDPYAYWAWRSGYGRYWA